MRKGIRILFAGLMGVLIMGVVAGDYAQPVGAAEAMTLKLACPVSETHHVTQLNLQPLAKDIAEKTKGQVKIEIYYSQTLTKAAQSYEAVRTGLADMAFVVPGNTPGQFPITSIASLPFAFSTGVNGAKSLLALYKAGYLDKEYSEVYVVSFGSSSPNQIHLTNKRPMSLGDFQGLKIRSSGGYVSKTLQAVGMTPINMPAADLYLSMQRGVIDGTVLAYASAGEYKLAEFARNVCELSLGGTPLVVIMNKNVWQKLSKDVQKVFEGVQEKATFRGGNSYDESDLAGKKMYADAGANMYKVAPAEMKKIMEKGNVVWADWVKEMEGKGLPGQKACMEYVSILEKLGENPPDSK